MNWHQFRAFLWLRWRLLVNQMRRGGVVNFVLLIILGIMGVATAISLFLTALLVGLFLPSDMNPNVYLYIFDGFALAFLFIWSTGLIVELQRSEVLSLDKFLHLPVSLTGAFFINYLSSLFSITMLLLLPPMLALTLGLAISRGPVMLLLLPLLAAFLLMITGPTYQLQGWLASLMANPRRRRNVVVIVMMCFILLCQAPNAVNLYFHSGGWDKKSKGTEIAEAGAARKEKVVQEERAGKISHAHSIQEQARIDTETAEQAKTESSEEVQGIVQTVEVMSAVLPPGWLGLGARGAADGKYLPVLLGFVGMGAIGSFSLWRAYRTTVRLYTGYYSSGKRSVSEQPAPLAPAAAGTSRKVARELLLEKKLPWISEQAAAVALGGFKSLIRAPEAKLILLTPIILVVVFGGMFMAGKMNIPVGIRPLMAFGGTSMVLLGMIQLVGNQFGFDRAGFRIYVLSAVPRREILLGKNLAVAPLAFGLAAILDTVVELFYPMRPDDLLAIIPQAVSMFLLFCMLTNWMSILAPMPIRPGSLKPVNPKGVQILFQIFSAFVFPLALMPALLPLGVELLASALEWWDGFPYFLVLSVVEVVLLVLLYRVLLTWQGKVLHNREQKILEVVGVRVE